MNAHRRRHDLRGLVMAGALLLTACSSSSERTTPDTTPTEETAPPPPAPPPPQDAEPKVEEEQPPPEEPPPAPSATKRYTGMPVVLTRVERETITCTAQNASASQDDNRRACVRDLESQVSDAAKAIVVVDEMLGQGCPNCLMMTADVSEVAHPGEHPRVLFAKQNAGTVECTAGADGKTLEATRKECYEILRREAGSLRAGVVMPMGIDEGEPCKSCIGVVGTGFVAEVLK